jgi:membrane associated rhomboid family serine protease
MYRGSRALCSEYSLVLEAKAIEHNIEQSGNEWALTTPPAALHRALEEIRRYSDERSETRGHAAALELHSGAAVGAVAYVAILLLIAYCTGIAWLGADWLSAGALDAGAAGEWWRAVTALTLHVDQEHLLGNLLFGVMAGMGAARLLGPGVAWSSILAAGALANYAEMLIAPPMHRAVGASTAVFAALGLLAGLAWRQRVARSGRRWHLWAPLIAGVCLLTLLGAGTPHVDVLGHTLGFIFGVAAGWLYARTGLPRNRAARTQIIAGGAAVAVISMAWFLALIRVP